MIDVFREQVYARDAYAARLLRLLETHSVRPLALLQGYLAQHHFHLARNSKAFTTTTTNSRTISLLEAYLRLTNSELENNYRKLLEGYTPGIHNLFLSIHGR